MCVCACVPKRERESGSRGWGWGADVCAEQNSLLGAGSTPPSQFQCPRLSLTGHSQGDLLFFFFTTHTCRDAHRCVLRQTYYSTTVRLKCHSCHSDIDE